MKLRDIEALALEAGLGSVLEAAQCTPFKSMLLLQKVRVFVGLVEDYAKSQERRELINLFGSYYEDSDKAHWTAALDRIIRDIEDRDEEGNR